MKDKVLANIDQEGLVDLAVNSVKINTVNPPGNERGLAELWANKMEEVGMEVEVNLIEDGRANVVGVLKGSGEAGALLFNGHLDTVPPGEVEWEFGPFSGAIEEGKIYGRGASDMKSGVAAMIMAAKALQRAGVQLPGDLIIAGTAGEEVDSLGAQQLLENRVIEDVEAIVIAEPSSNEIFVAEKGALWLEFTTLGKTAHGSMPDEGLNAILAMTKLIEKLVDYQFDYQEHEFFQEPTLNVGTIKGGVKTNVVPDKCSLTVDIRTIPGMDHEEIIRDFETFIKEISKEEEDLKVEMEVKNNRPAVETDPEDELVQLAIETGKEVFAKKLEPQAVNYYTDAAVFIPELELPMFILGPGDAKLAHQPNEYVEVDNLEQAAQFYALFVQNYFSNN